MRNLIYYSVIIVCAIGFIILNILYYNENKKENVIVEEPKKEVIKETHNKLMIVAHPDDDTIFGGAHLLSDDYTVICVTCGVKEDRLNEFKNVMSFSNDKYVYLKHTDLEPGAIISDWVEEKDIINKELYNYINSRDWDIIVTHNPDGEYGHKHHRMVSEMVTNNVKNKDKLFYFGIYYPKDTVNDEKVLDDDIYQKKREMLALYVSQKACTDEGSLTYMFNHENWINYKDWES